MWSENCKCSLRTKALGDGCQYCNPGYVIDMLKDEVEELQKEIDALGSCAECIHYTCVGYTPKGEKKAPDMCRLVWSAQEADHFCKKFEAKS